MAARPARAWSAFPSRPSSCGWARARRRLAGQGPWAPGGYQLRGCARARTACRAPAAKALGPRAISGPSPLGLSGAAAPSAGERRGPGPRGRARGGRRGPQQGEARRSQRPARGSSGARVHPGRGATGPGGGGGRRRPDPQRGPLQAPGGWAGKGLLLRAGLCPHAAPGRPGPGGRRAEGWARSGQRGPGQVQRPPRAQLPPGRASRRPAPRAGRYRAPRSRPPRQRPQIGGAAAPESRLGPGRLRCALPPPPLGRAPRRLCSSGRAEGGACGPRFAEGSGGGRGGRARFRPGEQLRPSGGLRPGRFPGPPRPGPPPPPAAASRLLPGGARAKSLPGAAGRLRRRMSSPPGGDPVPHARLGRRRRRRPRGRPGQRLGPDPGDARALELPAPAQPGGRARLNPPDAGPLGAQSGAGVSGALPAWGPRGV